MHASIAVPGHDGSVVIAGLDQVKPGNDGAESTSAPDGLTEIIFTTDDSVQVQETMDEIHQKMGVPSVP